MFVCLRTTFSFNQTGREVEDEAEVDEEDEEDEEVSLHTFSCWSPLNNAEVLWSTFGT
jgi:hypothetical protein